MLFVACTLYIVLSCSFLRQPGLEYDEVLMSSAALNIDGSFLAYSYKAADHIIPLMLMTYIGAIKAYIYKPIFMLLQPTALTVRLPVIIIGLIALVFTYLLVKDLFGNRVAFIAALLLATDPSYIFHVRADWGPVALMLLFKVGSLYFLARFAQTSRSGFLAIGALFLGLGLYDKANFLWYLFALPLPALMMWGEECRRRFTLHNVTIAVVFFLFGSWPLLLYNIMKKGATFKGQMQQTGSLLTVLQYKTNLLIVTLNGNAAYHFFSGGRLIGPFSSVNGTPADNYSLATTLLVAIDFRGSLMPFALPGAVLLIVIFLCFKQAAAQRAILFFCLLSLLILFQIYITPKATGSHHIMMLYPFPQIIVAYAVSVLLSLRFSSIKRSQMLRAIIRPVSIGILAVLITSNLVADVKYLQFFVESGGRGIWSDAIYDLADYAEQNSDHKFVLMDWGFDTQLQLLSRGRIKREEFFGTLLAEKQETELMDELYQKVSKEDNDTFIFHAPQSTQFSRPRRIFDLMLEKYGLAAETTKVFYQRDGEPVYILQRVH